MFCHKSFLASLLSHRGNNSSCLPAIVLFLYQCGHVGKSVYLYLSLVKQVFQDLSVNLLAAINSA